MDTTMLQLRSFIHGRLHTAAEEILGEVEKTITFALYEAEVSRSKEEIVSLRHQLGRLREKSAAELSLMSGTLEHRDRAETPLPQENPTEESNLSLSTEVPPPSQTSEDLENNSWNSFLVKTEFKMSDIKEEQEEIDSPSLEIVASKQDESEQDNFEDDQLEQHQFEDDQLEQHQSEIQVSFDMESVSSDRSAAQSDSDSDIDEELMKNIEAWTKDLESVRRRDRTFCHVCGKQFQDYYTLMKHINLHESTVDCTICGVELPSTTELLSHMKASHKKSHSCPICGNRFSSNYFLQIHNKTHMVNNKFVCPECGRTFLRHISLIVHIKTHSGEKPYRCGICAKAFSKSQGLANHKRSHSGEKLYSCALCDKSYTTGTELKKHTRQHSGEKPHSCDVCHQHFYTSEQARKHKAKHK